MIPLANVASYTNGCKAAKSIACGSVCTANKDAALAERMLKFVKEMGD